MKHTDETKRKVSEKAKSMWAEMTQDELAALVAKRNATNIARYGTAGPSFLVSSNPYSRAKGGRRPDLDNRFFRSAWEANYARYLNFIRDNGVIALWEYETETFIFHGVTRGALTYTPDFKVTGVDGEVVYHEVKGWMDSKSKTKLKRMKKYYPHIVIRVIGPNEYRAIARQCAGMLDGWE